MLLKQQGNPCASHVAEFGLIGQAVRLYSGRMRLQDRVQGSAHAPGEAGRRETHLIRLQDARLILRTYHCRFRHVRMNQAVLRSAPDLNFRQNAICIHW